MADTIANRKALGDVQENWDTLVQAVEGLPFRVKEEAALARKRDPRMSEEAARVEGTEQAIAFGRTHLRGMVGTLSLSWGRTAQDEMNVHKIHMLLTEGPLRVMARDSHAGLRLRSAFLEAVAAMCLLPTDKAVFERSREDGLDEPYVPDTAE